MSFVGGVFSYESAADNEDGTWCDWWLVEDLQYPLTRLSAAAGYPRDEITVSPITMDDMRKGCWEQKARLEDMDVNHVAASLAFPSFPRFADRRSPNGKIRRSPTCASRRTTTGCSTSGAQARMVG